MKVGIIAPFSGPFSSFGETWKQGIAAYQKIHGKTPGGQDIELIFRDLTGPNPSEAKALAQELVIKDKVQYLGGVVFTPNAFAIAPVVEEAKVPTVIFNAATSSVLDKSKYFVRISYTLPQITVPIARFALEQNVKNVVTMVSDYAPGIDAETAFVKSFRSRRRQGDRKNSGAAEDHRLRRRSCSAPRECRRRRCSFSFPADRLRSA